MLNFDLADTVAGQDILKLGMLQGGLQKSREAVIEVLEVRFGRVSSELVDAIKELVDPSLLDALLKQAVLVKSIDEFVVALHRPQS
ncbi:MAG: hypothetical protein HQK56_19455 [Deltaproteobacteria bacterium]|nr:hypothetical protein [Deltaproteobacteria bacterium]